MEKIWSTISYLGLKDNSESASKRDVILTNRINFVIFMLAVLLTIVTTVIRELNQSEFTIHTKKILVLMIFCGFSFLFSAKGLFALTKINLVFTPLFVIILLPIFFGAIQQMDFIYGPIIILSLSLIPQLVLDPQRERKIYFFTLLFFLLVVALFDNLLVYFSPDELPITTVTHSFHEYYKTVFISSFLFFHAALFYLREQAFKYERELKTVNLILEQQRDEIADKNEELEQQHEEILTQSHELETINRHLEERVIAELSKNRKKDVMLIQQSRQAAMGEMIGNIAHQWRQPLSAVAVIIQNIQEAYNYNEINREYLENKVKQSMELIDICRKLLMISGIFSNPKRALLYSMYVRW
jgi:signal transduction histidine kinase